MYWRNKFLKAATDYMAMGYTRKEAEAAALVSIARKNEKVASRLRRESRIR